MKKALNGLKKGLLAWYEKIDGYFMSLGFNKSVVDPNLYYNIVGDECLILVLYVDDLLLIDSESLIVECKRALASEFEMKDLDMMQSKAVGSAEREREREAHIFKNLRERERFWSIFYIIHKNIYIYIDAYIYIKHTEC